MFAKRDEEVLAESPVGERAQMIHLDDFQPRDFSDSDFGRRILRVIVVDSVVFTSGGFNREYLRKRRGTLFAHTTSAYNQCV